MAQIFWLMGISGSGKTTLGSQLANYIKKDLNKSVEFIDGDIVRDFFANDLGFTTKARNSGTKRIAFAAYLLAKNNINVVVTNISGSEEIQEYLKEKLKKYLNLIYLECPISEVSKRDPKGLYKKYNEGEEKNLVGLDIPFHIPKNPDLIVKTANFDENKSFSLIKNFCFEKIK